MTSPDKNQFGALIPLRNTAPVQVERGGRIVSRMVNDALEIARRNSSLSATKLFRRIGTFDLCEPDYRQVIRWADALEWSPEYMLQFLADSQSIGPEIALHIENGSIRDLVWDGIRMQLDAFEWEPGLKLQRLSVPWGMPQWSTEATLLTLKTLILYNGHYGHDRGLDLSPVPGLMELWCDQSQLTKLDLSPVPGLRKLSCNENRLKELDLSPVPGLTSLSCIDNFLRELDLSPVPGLTSLYCLENHLSKLDLSPVPGLRELNCDENQLRKLDLSPVPKLKNLCCSRTSLRELDLSPVSGLTSLSCNENLLTKLDLSPVTGLTHLCCSKTHLRELDLSPVPGLTRLSCTENRLTVLDLRPLDNPNIDLDCDANVRIIR
jgi:Leucine-rich repeat (LRR) protein